MVQKTPPKQKTNLGEAALRESEERYRLFQEILRSSSDGILAVNRENEVLFANERFVEMWMIPQEVMAKKDDTLLIQYVLDQLSDPQSFLQKVQELYNSAEESFDTLYFKDERVFDRLSRPMLQETELRGRVWSFRDITKSKRAEETVTNSQKRFRALIENGRDNISLLAADGTLLWESPSTISTLGYAPDQFVGRNLFELIHPDDKDVARNMLVQITRKPGNSQEGVFRLLHGEGSWRWIEATATNLLHEPSVQAIVINYRDITERVQAETLREALLEIMQAGVTTKDLQDFLSLIHRSIAKVIYAENFFVVLYNKDTALFEEVYSVDKFDPPGPPSRDEKSISAYVIRTGQPLLLNDEQVFSELVAQGEVELVGTNSPSWMGVPLKTSKETIGAMVVQDYDIPNRYSERDMEVLASIAGQVALAVERRRAEESLAVSEAELRALFASMQDVALVIDRDGVYRKIAPTNPGLLVKPPEELLGKNLFDVFPAEKAEAFRGVVQRVLDTKQNAQIEYELIIAGRTVWFQTTISPLNADSTLWVAHDITRRKQVEEALQTAEANYRSTFENTTIGIYQSTPQGRFLSVNPGMARIFGYESPYEMLTSTTNIEKQYYVDPADRHGFQRLLMEQGEVREFIGLNKRKDGGHIWVLENARAVKDANGSILHYEGFVTDITERVQAEEALRLAEEKYRNIFENATEGIFQTVPSGKFITANPALARMLGHNSPEELIADVNDLNHEFYEQPARHAEFMRQLDGHGTIANFESKVYRKDGRTIWISENARAVRDYAGQVIHYEGTLIDITERVGAEMERQVLLEIMQGLVVTQDLKDFLRLVHHSIDKVIYAENFFVLLYNKDTDLFEEVYSVDKFDLPGPPIRLKKSTSSYVFRSGQPFLSTQARFDELVMQNEVELVGTNSPSWLGVPLRTSSETIGVMVVQDYDYPNRYSERDTEVLFSIAGQVALAIERKHAEEELRRARDELETTNLELQQSLEREKLLACTDGLTGLYNHRYIFELAAREFQAAVRHRRPLTFLMFDMDDFKQVNDTLGHTAGDKLLAMVAQTAVAQVRASDVVARYGGDEFIVLLPQASAQQALPIAERIRASVAAIRVDAFRDDKEPFVITLSMGIAEMWHEPVDGNVERVIQRADEAMYKAKQSGRNRIVVFGQDETGAT